MQRALPLAVSLVALALAPGCLISRNNVNEPLVQENVAKLQPGVTTAQRAVELLGAPTEVVQLGFRSAYRFEFATAKRAGLFLIVVNLSNTDTRSDRVWLFFDDKDVLTHVGSSFQAADASYSMPWTKD